MSNQINIQDWKVKDSSDVELGQVLRFTPSIDATKVVAKSLDGTVYIQTIGTGVKHASVSVFSSREQMSLINDCEAVGAVISVVYRDVKYIGYIASKVSWQAVMPGEWYNGTIDLIVEEEV